MPRRTNSSVMFMPIMRWEPVKLPGKTGLAWMKTLAKDETTGARTAVIKFDPGFRQEASVSTWPIDSYVLEGSMQCGNRTYEADTFHYRPVGTKIGPIETKTGCTRVIFTADDKVNSSKEEVFIQDTKLMTWGKSYADPTGLYRGVKDLRQDPIAKMSILLHSNFAPGLRSFVNEAEIHDHVEEAFVLYGEWEDYLGDIDAHVRFQPGFYVCRPPNESWHGDSLSFVVPSAVLIRRGWIGKTDAFRATDGKKNPKMVLKPLEFAE